MGIDSAFTRVASLSDLREDEATVITLEGRKIALFRVGSQVWALENTCPHRGGPIGDGEVRDGLVTCPWHDWKFDIRTGKCSFNPAAFLLTFPVRVKGNDIWVSPQPENS